MSKKEFFITFEGTDGTGKSTQSKLLASWLKRKGFSVVLTREPGGGRLAEKIRTLLLDPKLKISPVTELFLYEAARCDHVVHVIEPALKRKQWVICDRFTDATLAYQGAARGLPYKQIEMLNAYATNKRKPNLTIWLDLPPSRGLRHAGRRKSGHDRMEKEGLAFQKKVRRGYEILARREPRRIRCVAVQKSVSDTQNLIRALVKPFLR